MVFTSHAAVGALIGAKIKNLGLIIIVAILSHFVLDIIPHWDYIGWAPQKSDLFKMIIDGIIGAIIVFTIIVLDYLKYKKIEFKKIIFVFTGIFFSILPDILLLYCVVLHKNGFCYEYRYFNTNFLHFLNKKGGQFSLFNFLTEFLTIISVILFFLLGLLKSRRKQRQGERQELSQTHRPIFRQ